MSVEVIMALGEQKRRAGGIHRRTDIVVLRVADEVVEGGDVRRAIRRAVALDGATRDPRNDAAGRHNIPLGEIGRLDLEGVYRLGNDALVERPAAVANG